MKTTSLFHTRTRDPELQALQEEFQQAQGDLALAYRQFGQAQPGEDAALADKVIGRAAALLARLMGVRALYAPVISRGALEELNRAGIDAGCETTVEAIRNRAGTGLCPMEQLSKGVTEPEEMLARAEEFLAGKTGG